MNERLFALVALTLLAGCVSATLTPGDAYQTFKYKDTQNREQHGTSTGLTNRPLARLAQVVLHAFLGSIPVNTKT